MCKFCVNQPDHTISTSLINLESILRTPNLRKAVRLYFAPGTKFAGETYDSLGYNDPSKITTEDLLAVTLLDVSWRPSAVRSILVDQADKISELLCEIDNNTTLWDLDHGCNNLLKAECLWNLIDDLDGVGPTKTSKLLARKRPLLVPITDRIIVSAIGDGKNWWRTLRYCFTQETFRQIIDQLRPQEAENASLLRIFDVSIWILHSKSRDALKARQAAGVL